MAALIDFSEKFAKMDNIENVYQAIQCLSGQNPTDANTAAQWLAQFQKSVSLQDFRA